MYLATGAILMSFYLIMSVFYGHSIICMYEIAYLRFG